MGFQTTTTTAPPLSAIISPSSNYLHLVASATPIPLSSSGSTSPPTSPICNDRTHRQPKHEHHTSFDLTPVTPAWYVKRHSNKSHLRNWLDRQYYLYEVTWGLYVLTPTEKNIINTVILSFISLIVYGFTKIAMFNYIMGIIGKWAAISCGTNGLFCRN